MQVEQQIVDDANNISALYKTAACRSGISLLTCSDGKLVIGVA